MAEIPFSPEIKEKARLLAKASVGKALHFSEGAYQVEIIEEGAADSLWPFVQMDDRGKILDALCPCDHEGDTHCAHIAASFFRIFRGSSRPLHVRFRRSFWRALCNICATRHGYDESCLKEVAEGSYAALSLKDRALFTCCGKREAFDGLFFNRPEQTEGTSLKFFNLPDAELKRWRAKKPTPKFHFELSFWSDLAKELFLAQIENGGYEITFEEGEALPKKVRAIVGSFETSFVLTRANYERLIPALASVKAPLKVFPFGTEEVKRVCFDKAKGHFFFEVIPNPDWDEKLPRIEIGEWHYLKGKGFFPKSKDVLFEKREVSGTDVPFLITHYPLMVERAISAERIHNGNFPLKYTLNVDHEGTLRVESYLEAKGDLKGAHLYDSWLYVQGRGFFQIEERRFPELSFEVKKEKVSDFVSSHRVWLSNFEHFQIHLSSVESHFVFTVDQKGTLSFETVMESLESNGEVIDYGDWIYIRDKGFYAKMTAKRTGDVMGGMKVKHSRISHFIEKNREDLESVPGFLSESCPLKRSGLEIQLNELNEIFITPRYDFIDGRKGRVFGRFTYVEGEGFFELPPNRRLPRGFTREKVIEQEELFHFLTQELDALMPFVIHIDPRLKRPKELWLQITGVKKDTKKKGLWVLALEYRSAAGSVPAHAVWQAVKDNKTALYSKAGLIFPGEARYKWLSEIGVRSWRHKGTELKMNVLEWIRLTVFEDVRKPSSEMKGAARSLKQLEKLQTLQVDTPPDLKGLKSTLRPYQKVGLDWLWSLYCNGLSGLLCDEMGLGKTHQAMALLSAVSNSITDGGKFVIVCPTSVIYHWEDLLERFLPHLNVTFFYGINRSLDNFSQVLLTSYGTLRSEQKTLCKIPFDVAVYDEVHIAKNARSQTHRALKALKAETFLGLTGTPVENRLLELKALFDLVLPGYMPSDSAYKEFFANPIERDHNQERRDMLSRMIKPFLIRRRKEEVLQDLPEKTEEIAYSDLSVEQARMYNETLEKQRNPILQTLEDGKAPVPYTHIFALLTELKRICNHPSLPLKEVEGHEKRESGKWDLFVELLRETRDSGRKLVVFSQYLGMLDIIQDYLKSQKIGFAGIRGSTRDRKAQLVKFANDPKCEVFVASLQAAGVGIDLVSASVVIHYDRWWNPAKEAQATDRVHRIGQSRGVQVFKMVTKGTIEERIDEIIEKKRKLAEDVVGYDDEQDMKTLDRNELIELLKLADLK